MIIEADDGPDDISEVDEPTGAAMKPEVIRTSERLSEIEAREQKATKGPWGFNRSELGCRDIGWKDGDSRQARYRAIATTVGLNDDKQDRNNAEFITHARTDIHTLCATIRELWEQQAERDRELAKAVARRDEISWSAVSSMRATALSLTSAAEYYMDKMQSLGMDAHLPTISEMCGLFNKSPDELRAMDEAAIQRVRESLNAPTPPQAEEPTARLTPVSDGIPADGE